MSESAAAGEVLKRRGASPDLDGKGLRIAIVAARFNAGIVDAMLAACLGRLRELGVEDGHVHVARVPGAYELPFASARLLRRRHPDAVIALGAVIRGETPHFDYVCAAAAQGLREVSVDMDTPVVFGVLTTDTVEQALARAGGDHGNKGRDAAEVAVEMAGFAPGG